MKLLVTTQAVDTNDLYTSFFPGWLTAFSKEFEHIHVICLKEGTYSVPNNVQVHTLGKSASTPGAEGTAIRLKLRLTYMWRLLRLAWKFRREYDAVFVHMNQEYLLVAGLLWLFLGKRMYLWRNHYQPSLTVDLVAPLCTKIFCTSRFSYTAKFKKTVFMPVGVESSLYKIIPGIERKRHSILFWGRISPSKRPEMLIKALSSVRKRGIPFTASFYGSPLPKDEAYYADVQKVSTDLGLDDVITFFPGKPHPEGPAIFNAHEIFVNLSLSGMYDKTIFEAAASGLLVVAASKDFAQHVDPMFVFEENGSDLEEKMAHVLQLPESEIEASRARFLAFAESQSLANLARRLAEELDPRKAHVSR